MHRSSTGNLDHFEEPPRGGERWDRDRFERMRRGGGGGDDSRSSVGGGRAGGSRPGGRGGDDYEHFRFQEHDRFPGGHRDIDIHEDRQRQGGRVMEKERERFHDDHHFDRPSRRQTDFFHESTPSEVANQALAPYRRKSVIEKDVNVNIDIHQDRDREPPRPVRPARPGYIRRQSSLDTFDRRPPPRYAQIERYETHDYRPPVNVPIPLPIRERRRSPPRRFREEEDFEEIKFEERDGRHREREEYREVEVHKEKSRVRRSKSRAKSTKSTRSSSMSSFEEVQPPRATWGKRGKTRLPKRLVKKQAVIDLGYPFEEEDDFIIVTRALEKDHIDEVIKISENYKEQHTTYVYEEKHEEAPAALPPPPPPPASVAPPPPPPPAEFYPVPPPPVLHSPPPPPGTYVAPAPPHHAPSHYAPSHYAPSERPPSPVVHEHERYVEIERSAGIHGPATSFLPETRQIVRRRSERDIREEIRSLEEERRMLKYERDGERDYEFIDSRPSRREVIRVDKDRKGRLALVRSAR